MDSAGAQSAKIGSLSSLAAQVTELQKDREPIMSTNRMFTLIGAFIFLILAAVSLYRLLVWFPITIGGYAIGQTASFFAFVISVALCLILFRGARAH
jgi:hypothetical protein